MILTSDKATPAPDNKPFKLEGVPERKLTVADLIPAVKTYQEELIEAINERAGLVVKFGQLRDAKIQSPTLERDLQDVHKRIQFLDAATRRMNDLFLAGSTILEQSKKDYVLFKRFPNIMSQVKPAIKVIVDQLEQRLDQTSELDKLVVSIFADFHRFSKVTNLEALVPTAA